MVGLNLDRAPLTVIAHVPPGTFAPVDTWDAKVVQDAFLSSAAQGSRSLCNRLAFYLVRLDWVPFAPAVLVLRRCRMLLRRTLADQRLAAPCRACGRSAPRALLVRGIGGVMFSLAAA